MSLSSSALAPPTLGQVSLRLFLSYAWIRVVVCYGLAFACYALGQVFYSVGLTLVEPLVGTAVGVLMTVGFLALSDRLVQMIPPLHKWQQRQIQTMIVRYTGSLPSDDAPAQLPWATYSVELRAEGFNALVELVERAPDGSRQVIKTHTVKRPDETALAEAAVEMETEIPAYEKKARADWDVAESPRLLAEQTVAEEAELTEETQAVVDRVSEVRA